MAEATLVVDGVGVTRGGREILRGVSFTAAAGEVTALLGPNGAGKSTLLKAVAGLLPHEGEIAVAGRSARTLGRRERAALIGYVPQHSALEAPLLARDVVAQGRFARRGLLEGATRADEQAIERALRATDAWRLADRRFDRLSYGERRLVLLARALATEAPLLLLDEPTAALDVGHALALLELLRFIAREGRCVLVVLHQLQEAASTCARAVLLDGGAVAAYGAVSDVISDRPIRRVYGVELVPGGQFGYRAAKDLP